MKHRLHNQTGGYMKSEKIKIAALYISSIGFVATLLAVYHVMNR